MTHPFQHLRNILDLVTIDQNMFCGQSGNSHWQRVLATIALRKH
ncbi:hypothetical protein [Bartonella tamiae]|nr:hypothetical protein [Bartonella tamiae]